MGTVSGILTGVIAVLFRLTIELPLEAFLPAGSESFEALPVSVRFGLPLLGGLVIGLLLHYSKSEHHEGSVGHVIDRLQHHQGHLPKGNAILQFVAAAIALLTGNSVGREGPAVHLGAASSSLLGQSLKLPNNSLRTLCACGVASAIAASFNTPLAGVIFAMEVVMMEYTIAGFIPVILAAVSGAILSRLTFGTDPAFAIPPLEAGSLWDLPFLLLAGFVVGLLAAAVLHLHSYLRQFNKQPVFLRMLFIGLLTGTIATVIPQVSGVGYDTLQQAMLGELSLGLLAAIVIAKLITATTTVSLGMPGGIIGPSLVIGACTGACIGIFGTELYPDQGASSGFYAILGMGAMMGAVLNAPLAALIAIMELTYHPRILLPGMLTIVIATITARVVGNQPGIFSIGRDRSQYTSPVFQMLSRAGVTSLMEKNFVHHSHLICLSTAREILEKKPQWLTIEDVGEPKFIFRPADLAHYLETEESLLWEDDKEIDLLKIPADRWRLHPIHEEATLQEALLKMRETNGRAVYVHRSAPPLMSEVAGIITLDAIDNYYL